MFLGSQLTWFSEGHFFLNFTFGTIINFWYIEIYLNSQYLCCFPVPCEKGHLIIIVYYMMWVPLWLCGLQTQRRSDRSIVWIHIAWGKFLQLAEHFFMVADLVADFAFSCTLLWILAFNDVPNWLLLNSVSILSELCILYFPDFCTIMLF